MKTTICIRHSKEVPFLTAYNQMHLGSLNLKYLFSENMSIREGGRVLRHLFYDIDVSDEDLLVLKLKCDFEFYRRNNRVID